MTLLTKKKNKITGLRLSSTDRLGTKNLYVNFNLFRGTMECDYPANWILLKIVKHNSKGQ